MKIPKVNPVIARNRDDVIRVVFSRRFSPGSSEVMFTMDDIRAAIDEVAARCPGYHEKNVADVRYEYASGRRSLPADVDRHGPWMFGGRGKAKYALIRLAASPVIHVSEDLQVIHIPDATPEIVLEYAGRDEQGLLAKIRYNRLLDVFLQITCYHLQNHWRTTVKRKGQREIDDLYVGINTHGKQFVMPIEAKSVGGNLAKTQIFQNIEFARERYPMLLLRPVGVQEMSDGSLVLIEFTAADNPDAVKVVEMRRYRLVPMSQVPLDAIQARP